MAEPVTPESIVLAGSTYEADYELAGATLRQCADEIQVIVQAMQHGCADSLVQTVLMGIAGRMAIAADVAALAAPAVAS